MDPRSSRFVLEEQLPLAAASLFSVIRRVYFRVCMCVCVVGREREGRLKPVKYSIHAQLLPFVRCTYAVRLIVAPKKKQPVRRLMVTARTPSRISLSRGHVRGSLDRNVCQNWRNFENHEAPEREKNHLATVGISDVPVWQYSNIILNSVSFSGQVVIGEITRYVFLHR